MHLLRWPLHRVYVAWILLLVSGSASAGDWWTDVALKHQLYPAIKKFSRDARGNYFEADALVADQVEEGLGGPPSPEVKIDNGDRFISAKVPHEGDLWSGVVIDPGLKVVAAALISFGCERLQTNSGQDVGADRITKRRHATYVRCGVGHPKLTVFTRGNLDPEIQQVFLSWAHTYESQQSSQLLHLQLDNVEVRNLADVVDRRNTIDRYCDALIEKSGGVTDEMRNASQKCYERWDNELNTVYQDLMEELSSSAEAKLRDAERAWLKWGDSESKASNAIIFGPHSGTLALIVADSRGNMLLRNRVLFLEDYEGLPNHGLKVSVLEYDGFKPMPLDGTFDQEITAAGNDTAKLIHAYNDNIKAWDTELNDTYNDLITKADPNQRNALRQAERDWLVWRDKEIALEQALVNQRIDSHQQELILADYRRLLLRARTIDLAAYSNLLNNAP